MAVSDIPIFPPAAREIEAFTAGESSITAFFASPWGRRLDEVARRNYTPELLQQNAANFAILVSVAPNGSIKVIEGAHRLAIAKLQGLEKIWVKVGWEGGQKLIWHPRSRPFWSWYLRPFKKL